MQGSRWAILNAKDLQALKPIFKAKWMNKINEFSFNMLEAQDAYFVKAVYISSVGQIMAARGLTKVNQDIIDYATLRAQEMTFRDPSKMATAINNLKKIPGLGILVETAVPFVKTPINITKKGT